MAPQGAGAAMAMPIAGTLTDRVGGGRVALGGLVLVTVSTVPFASIQSDTPYGLLAAMLVVRGLGIGGAMMPAMAVAYATLQRSDVPRATSALNVLQRIGGSVGTALLAVILQHEIAAQLSGAPGGVSAGGGEGALQRLPEDVRSRVAEPIAGAFGHTFWWAVGLVLAVSQRRARRAQTLAEAQSPVG